MYIIGLFPPIVTAAHSYTFRPYLQVLAHVEVETS